MRKAGAALFWTGLLGSPLMLLAGPAEPAVVVATLLGTVVMFAGAAMMIRGRKLLARSGEQSLELEDDRRPSVVYLRSFAADQEGAGVVNSWALLRPTYYTEEEQLAGVLNEIGPFIAIGDPHEKLPDLGAARIYVRGDDWHQKVGDLLSRAGLVILRAGTTEGFWWEFKVVRGSINPERLLLLIPTGTAEYEEFRKRAAPILPHPLPDLPRRGRVLGHTRAVLSFDANWRPSPLPIVSSFSRTPMKAPYAARVKLTLRPIFERLGVPWSAPPIQRAKMITLAIGGVTLGGMVLIWMATELPQYFYTPPETSEAVPIATVVPEKAAFDTEREALTSRLSALPAFRAALSTATDQDAARAIGRDLSQKGLRRVSDRELLKRALLMRRIADEADEDTCATLVTGEPAPRFEEVLRKVSPEEIRQWFDFTFNAVVAELEETPYPAAPPLAEVQDALEQLFQRLPRDDANLLRSVLATPQNRPVGEACRAARLLYAGLPEIPERARRVLVRALITQ